MIPIALSFLAGVLLLLLFDDVGSNAWGMLLASAVGLLLVLHFTPAKFLFRSQRVVLQLLLVMLAGLCWAGFQAQDYLQQRLPESLAGKDILLTGIISSLVETDSTDRRKISRFEMTIDDELVSRANLPADFPRKLRLSWYYGKPVHPGEHWQLLLRLKPPHGFMNPGGFDYEAWLYQHSIHATGYVRKSDDNRRLPEKTFWQRLWQASMQSVISSINQAREAVLQHIDQQLQQHPLAGVIKALATGSRKDIASQQWQTFITTGTNHLMAISGLHIGLAAAFGFGIGLFAAKRMLPSLWLLYLPAQHIATVAALLAATAYTMLSGLGIPAQRALLMLAGVSAAFLLRRHFRPLDALALALLLVLILHPASVLAPGFWFSFLAVMVIMLAYQHGLSKQPWWKQLLWLQLILALSLLPVSLQWFNQVSLVSPLANLIMVPYVSFTVVPLVLLAVVMLPFSESLSSWLLQLAHWLLQQVWPFLQWLAQQDAAYQALTVPSPVLLVILIALLLVLFPALLSRWLPQTSHWKIRLLAAPALLLLLVDFQPEIAEGSVLVDVLDVGQGTAVVVRTRNHTLVYDSGARFSSKLDGGASVVIPFLREQGVRQLDRLVISHGDNDHIGGANSILQAFPHALVTGQQIDKLDADGSPCLQGQHWQWDGVKFRFLHPSSSTQYKKSNNLSCVLLISAPGGSVLLSGDIEKKVERRLLKRYGGELKADVLLVAHHGSKSSSSVEWVKAVSPRYAVITAGYRNRYRLPARTITRRYLEQGSEVLVSGLSGAIHFDIDADTGVSAPRLYRLQAARYWHHRLSYARVTAQD